MTARITYVLPVHNQERVIESSAVALTQRLADFPGSEALLVENGSTDRSALLCADVAQRMHSATVAMHAVQSARGMGCALRRGMELATGDLIVLSAGDLPFGFTDLDAYMATNPPPRCAVGSKAHPHSRVHIGLQRRLMSDGFRVLRELVVGLTVGDSQGTLLLDAALARAMLPHLRCDDFLIATEILCWAARLGAAPVELPVTYTASGGSTVSPVRDSVRMALGLFALRRRLNTVQVAV